MKKAWLFLTTVIITVLCAEFLVRAFVPVRELGSVLSVQSAALGKQLRPNVRTERHSPEFTMRFSTNSEGFRGHERRGFAKPVLFLGDSFTMGYGVSDGLEFPALVQARLRELFPDRATEVVNAGVGNNGNGQWLKFLRLHLQDIDPLIVVLQLSQNDFDDNLTEDYFALSADGQLIEHEVHISMARKLEYALSLLPGVADSYLYAAMREAYAYSRQFPLPVSADVADAVAVTFAEPETPSPPDYRHQLTSALVTEAIDMCQSNGYPVLALLVGLQGTELSIIRGVLDKYDVPALTIPDKPDKPGLYFAVDGHWNESGHEFVAGQLVDQLLERAAF